MKPITKCVVIQISLLCLIGYVISSDEKSKGDVIFNTTGFQKVRSARVGFDKQYEVQDKIVNPHNFKYILNPKFDVCGNGSDNVFLLIYVHSSPKNYKRRIAIRETWAKRSVFNDVRIVFMMGMTEEKDVQNLINLESNYYNDIVQENFQDSYRNLTFKGIMAMKWITEYCNHTEFILKTDDDIITNTFIILRHLRSLSEHNIYNSNSVLCLVWSRMKVMRDTKSKWYMPKELFEPDYFTSYCSGSAYMFTGDLPLRMYTKSQYIKFLWVDDYYITGLLTDAVNATFHSLNKLYIVNSGLVESRFYSKKESGYTVFGHIPNAINKMYSLWGFIYRSELAKQPQLKKKNGKLVRDFINVGDFSWSSQIWEPYIRAQNEKDVSFLYDSY